MVFISCPYLPRPKVGKYDKACSAVEGQKLTDMVVETLLAIRNEDAFDLFWLKVLRRAESFDPEPQLPRQRKRSRPGDMKKMKQIVNFTLILRLTSENFTMKLLTLQ